MYLIFLFSGQRSEDKKGGVDRSSTVIAKDPEGKFPNIPYNNITIQGLTRLPIPNIFDNIYTFAKS